MNPAKIIVVGGNSAGPAAAAKAKRVNPGAVVYLFEAGQFISTGTCEIPYVLSGEIKDYEDVVFYNPESFLRKKGVQVFVRHSVEDIDRRAKTITVNDLQNDKLVEYKYDTLILCTGSYAKMLPGFSTDFKNVFKLKNIGDLILLEDYLKNNPVKRATIIGSGYIGLELSDALHERNISTTILEKEVLPLPSAGVEISKRILTELEVHNVNFIGGCNNLEPFVKEDKVISVKADEDYIESDLVLMATGIAPNNLLAQKAKLEIGNFGGIIVDKKLKTSDSYIFAAGDNIEYSNALTVKPDYFPFSIYSHSFGHIAGENAAGGNANAEPIIKNVSVKVFNYYFASVGLNTKDAELSRFKFFTVTAEAPNLVTVMPESKNSFGKLIFDIENNKILGASFFGGKEVSGYADLIASAVYSKQKIGFLTKITFNYTPPLSPFINLLSVLGRKAVAKSKR
jgi:NADPH-dependent 2,4-dienoyl-CoA reductase/sulfur reductase-like enzyme